MIAICCPISISTKSRQLFADPGPELPYCFNDFRFFLERGTYSILRILLKKSLLLFIDGLVTRTTNIKPNPLSLRIEMNLATL